MSAPSARSTISIFDLARRGPGHRRRQFGTARTAAARRPHPGHVGRPPDRHAGPRRGERGAHHAACRAAREPRQGGGMSVLKLLSRTKLYWGLIAIFLIGVAVLAGHLVGQEHLPVLRQSARRAAPGLDHRPDRDRHDGRHHHRRHRPLGRLADGDLLSVVCAMLLTVPGYTPAALMGVPTVALVALLLGFVAHPLRLRQSREAPARRRRIGRDVRLDTAARRRPARHRRR